MNDVSFLFPLPADADAGALLSVSAAGPNGMLLPVGLRATLPRLARKNDRAVTVDDAVIVAVRVDPCFPDPQGNCHRQVRLVAQPLDENGAVDATVHLFYELSDSRFSEGVTRLRALKALAGDATGCAPLGVHPVMQREGLGGPYANALKSMVLELCGEQNLTRVAVMTLAFGIPSWGFSAFTVTDGGLDPEPIPHLSGAQQQQFTQTLPPPSFGEVSPEPAASPMQLLLRGRALRDAGADDVVRAIDDTYRIENPTRSSPRTVDCVSCHVAGRARHLAWRERMLTAESSAERYRNAQHDLSLVDDGLGLRSQRIFGYLNRIASISARAANESAAVCDALNRWP